MAYFHEFGVLLVGVLIMVPADETFTAAIAEDDHREQLKSAPGSCRPCGRSRRWRR